MQPQTESLVIYILNYYSSSGEVLSHANLTFPTMYIPHKTQNHFLNYISSDFLIFKLTLSFFIDFFFGRRNEDNYLDLNNLPDDFSRDGNKQALEEGSSSSMHTMKNPNYFNVIYIYIYMKHGDIYI